MECTKCRNKLELSKFSLKNTKDKIYYLHCNDCRKTDKELYEKYKNKAKEDYELNKKTNKILCECGKDYIAFRSYHIYRHNNTKKHIEFINNINNKKVY